MAKICPEFRAVPDVLELAESLRTEPVVAKICLGFRAVPDVVELAGCLRAEPVVAKMPWFSSCT